MCNRFVRRPLLSLRSGDGRLGVLGQHGQRDGGLHSTLRGLPQDPPPPPAQAREAGGTPVQEVGGGSPGRSLRGGWGRVHGEQFLSRFRQEQRRRSLRSELLCRRRKLVACEGGRGRRPCARYTSMYHMEASR